MPVPFTWRVPIAYSHATHACRYDATFAAVVFVAQSTHFRRTLRATAGGPAAHAAAAAVAGSDPAAPASGAGRSDAFQAVSSALQLLLVALAIMQLLLLSLCPERYSRIRPAWVLGGRLIRIASTLRSVAVPFTASSRGAWQSVMSGVRSNPSPTARAWQMLFTYGGPLHCLLLVCNVFVPARWSVWLHLVPCLAVVRWHSRTMAHEMTHPAVLGGYVRLCHVPLQTASLMLGPMPLPGHRIEVLCRRHVRAVVVAGQVLLGYVLPVALAAGVELAVKQSVVEEHRRTQRLRRARRADVDPPGWAAGIVAVPALRDDTAPLAQSEAAAAFGSEEEGAADEDDDQGWANKVEAWRDVGIIYVAFCALELLCT